MKQTLTIAALAAILSASAVAQYAQPVRDADKDARAIATGTCAVSILPGDGDNGSNCLLDIQGTAAQVVPAGKVLVVDEVSSDCGLAQGLLLRTLRIGGPAYQKALPMLLQTTSASGTRYYSNTWLTHFYVAAGSAVRLRMTLDQPVVAGSGYCVAQFAGHLVNV